MIEAIPEAISTILTYLAAAAIICLGFGVLLWGIFLIFAIPIGLLGLIASIIEKVGSWLGNKPDQPSNRHSP